MPAKKTARKAQVKVRDLKTKKNPKAGGGAGKIKFNEGPAGKTVKIDF